jgi:amidase
VKQGPAWLVRLDAPPGDGPTVAVKDAIDVAGTVTTVGARSREDSPPATADAPCVAAVRRSGGRIIGKTNLSELCWFADGVNEHTGTPVNPLDPRRVPGGSSSGSAVAVALGEADLALGTDTGGSVRIPAAACGIAGLKTTRGRISTAGVFPLSPPLDTVGPLAPDVAGLVTAMALLEPGFEAVLPVRRPVVVRLRVGEDVGVAPDVEHDVDEALAAAGWEVREQRVYGWARAVSAAGRILDAEAGPAQASLLDRPELLSDKARAAIEACLRERPEDVARARATMVSFDDELAALLADADAMVLPTLVDAPPLLEASDELRLTVLTIPFNALGWPALSVPARAVSGDGDVPPSVQLTAGPASEERLLGLGSLLPTQVAGRDGPPV